VTARGTNAKQIAMKNLLFALVAVLFVSACSSGVSVGTRHHRVAFGGSIGR
jgi:hypothetical protein